MDILIPYNAHMTTKSFKDIKIYDPEDVLSVPSKRDIFKSGGTKRYEMLVAELITITETEEDEVYLNGEYLKALLSKYMFINHNSKLPAEWESTTKPSNFSKILTTKEEIE